MKLALKLEELALLLFGIWVFRTYDFAWWWFPALILVPDFSMIGYVFGNRVGAWTYNLAHHRAFALAIGISGWYLEDRILVLAGIILFSHIAMDRVLGYGLKYERGFKFTHLGEIGK